MSNPIFSRCTPVSPDVYVFKTNYLEFVAACLCLDLYSYLGVETTRDRKTCVFFLEDVSRTGEEAQKRFARGQFEKVDPLLFSEARQFLVGEVLRARNRAVVREQV